MPGTVTDIDVATLKQWMKEGKVLLIDVREPVEYHDENITGALLLPLSQFDTDQVPDAEGKYVVFHCARGGRSLQAAQKWTEVSNKDAYNLKGGITSWKEEGNPTNIKMDISTKILKATNLVAGAAVILLSLLTLLHPNFVLLSLVIISALIFFGTAGTDWLPFLWSHWKTPKK